MKIDTECRLCQLANCFNFKYTYEEGGFEFFGMGVILYNGTYPCPRLHYFPKRITKLPIQQPIAQARFLSSLEEPDQPVPYGTKMLLLLKSFQFYLNIVSHKCFFLLHILGIHWI